MRMQSRTTGYRANMRCSQVRIGSVSERAPGYLSTTLSTPWINLEPASERTHGFGNFNDVKNNAQLVRRVLGIRWPRRFLLSVFVLVGVVGAVQIVAAALLKQHSAPTRVTHELYPAGPMAAVWLQCSYPLRDSITRRAHLRALGGQGVRIRVIHTLLSSTRIRPRWVKSVSTLLTVSCAAPTSWAISAGARSWSTLMAPSPGMPGLACWDARH
jgi:hypothetical protein